MEEEFQQFFTELVKVLKYVCLANFEYYSLSTFHSSAIRYDLAVKLKLIGKLLMKSLLSTRSTCQMELPGNCYLIIILCLKMFHQQCLPVMKKRTVMLLRIHRINRAKCYFKINNWTSTTILKLVNWTCLWSYTPIWITPHSDMNLRIGYRKWNGTCLVVVRVLSADVAMQVFKHTKQVLGFVCSELHVT